MIREFQESDIEQVMKIWLSGNEDAHFFVPKEYWHSHFAEVRKQIAQAEVSVYETDGEIQGFIGITDGYIAGIFVEKCCRSQGIGRQLLEYAKQTHGALSLNVYRKNERAAALYLREGFVISAENIEEDTGETEYTMIWEKRILKIKRGFGKSKLTGFSL